MRFTAVFALNPNSDAGFKLIEQSLKDEDSGVRIMAGAKLAAVSSSRHEEAVKALKSLANDKDEEVVRNQMHRSLQVLSPRPRK